MTEYVNLSLEKRHATMLMFAYDRCLQQRDYEGLANDVYIKSLFKELRAQLQNNEQKEAK